MAAPAFGTRFPDGWSQYTDGDTSSFQSATPQAVTGVSGFATGTAMEIAVPANNVSNPGTGATADPTHQRCEVMPAVAGLGAVNSDGDVHNGATGYFGLAIRLSSGFPTTATSWQLCTQFKNDGTGSPPLELKIGIPPSGGSQGYFYLDGNSGGWSLNICPANPGQVYGIVLGITFTESASTSLVSAWVNGTQYLNNASPTGMGFLYAGLGDYWKVGIYRDGPNIPQAATIDYGALAHDLNYQPVADYITGTLTQAVITPPTTTTDQPAGAEQGRPGETPGVGLVKSLGGASGTESGAPVESSTANQGVVAAVHGAEQGSTAETTSGAAISNTPVTSPDAPAGAEQSAADTETQFAGTLDDGSLTGELPVVVVPPNMQGPPGSAPVSDPQHFTIPMQLLPSGSFATWTQDSPEEVVGCVAMLLGTRTGELIEVPQFGVPDPTFMTAPGHWAAILETAVQKWEPRAAGAAIPVVINQDGTASVQVSPPTRPDGPAL